MLRSEWINAAGNEIYTVYFQVLLAHGPVDKRRARLLLSHRSQRWSFRPFHITWERRRGFESIPRSSRGRIGDFSWHSLFQIRQKFAYLKILCALQLLQPTFVFEIITSYNYTVLLLPTTYSGNYKTRPRGYTTTMFCLQCSIDSFHILFRGHVCISAHRDKPPTLCAIPSCRCVHCS